MSPAKQANRSGRPWMRKDGRWAARAYPPDGSKPRMVYGATEAEVLDRQHEMETAQESGQEPAQLAPELARNLADLPPRPEKPIRFTLDLDQDRHLFLKRFAAESGAGTGGAAVLRALLDELAEGPNLAARVRARLWAAKP